MTDQTSESADGPAPVEELLVAAPATSSELDVSVEPGAESESEVEAAVEAEPEVEPDYLGDLQRVTADFANYRKQAEKRSQDVLARGSSRLAEALLPVLDACDAAALQGVEGVEPIHAQLLAVLGNEGLEVIDDAEEVFDPNRHEAVMTEPGKDDDEGTVVAEVLRTGYAWKGRVFRPAMVRVRG